MLGGTGQDGEHRSDRMLGSEFAQYAKNHGRRKNGRQHDAQTGCAACRILLDYSVSLPRRRRRLPVRLRAVGELRAAQHSGGGPTQMHGKP